MKYEEYIPEDGKPYSPGTEYNSSVWSEDDWLPPGYYTYHLIDYKLLTGETLRFRRPIPDPPQPDLREAIRELAEVVQQMAFLLRFDYAGPEEENSRIHDPLQSILNKLS